MKLKAFKQSNTLVALYVDSKGLASKKDFNNCIYSITKQSKSVDLVVFYNSLSKAEIKELDGILKNPVLTIIKADEKGDPITEEVKIEKGESVNYTLVNTEVTNFSQIFNLGFNYASENEFEYYSIIEQADTFAIYWFDHAEKFANEDESDIFLPLVRHTVNGVFQSLINEACWVEGMSEEAGTTDINLLLRFNSINPLGGLYRVSSLKEYSGEKEDGFSVPMKESMKITHTYEFFLRMIYEDLKVKTIARVGYELKIYSADSFNEASSKIPQNLNQIPSEKGGVSQEEIQFFIDSAKKEYFFTQDRNKVFEI